MSDAPQKPKWAKGGPSPNPGGRKKAPQPGVAQPVSTTEKRDTRFKAGNPGRPKGALNKSTMAALAIMEADAETISRKAVELALGGDLTAVRIVLDRLVAPGETGPLRSRSPRSSPRRTWPQQPRQSWKQSQRVV